MMKLVRKRWLVDALTGVMIVVSFAGLLRYPREVSAAVREGLRLCLDVLIPSLFPFFVLSSLIVELGLARYIGRAMERLMRPLFRVSGPCAVAVALGTLGGYPVGAKTAISLYEKKLCSQTEAERLLAFCNNSGPAFILGMVGSVILGSSQAGWLIFFAHTLASWTVGVIFRFYKHREPPSDTGYAESVGSVKFTAGFTQAVRSSFGSVFYIGAFVIFFTVVIQLLYVSGLLPGLAALVAGALAPLGMTEELLLNLLTGLLEMTSGLWSLQGNVSTQLVGRISMAAFMLGWAGLSVHCQVLSFIGQSGLSAKTYLVGKLLHGLLSALYAAGLTKLLAPNLPVLSVLAEQVEGITKLHFADTLRITLAAIGIVILLFVIILGLYRLARRRSLPRGLKPRRF